MALKASAQAWCATTGRTDPVMAGSQISGPAFEKTKIKIKTETSFSVDKVHASLGIPKATFYSMRTALGKIQTVNIESLGFVPKSNFKVCFGVNDTLPSFCEGCT